MEILEVSDLTFEYPGIGNDPPHRALDHVSFSLGEGEILLVVGGTGSGKSTLLRHLKREIRPLGNTSGDVLYRGCELDALDGRVSSGKIGFVSQYPEEGIVTDRVYHELSFGLENLGVRADIIRRRVAEVASYFGLGGIFESDTASLSGGQKQTLALASVLVTEPDILLLDEPTSQLDPIAAVDFLSIVGRLCRELSISVVIVEHRLEDVLPIADKILALDGGKVIAFGEKHLVTEALAERYGACSPLLPASARLYAAVGERMHGHRPDDCPLTLREGRQFIINSFGGRLNTPAFDESPAPDGDVVLSFDNVYHRYGRDSDDVLSGLSFSVHAGECFALLGGNGSGKSTALRVAASLLKPYSGKITFLGKKLSSYREEELYHSGISLLPQEVKTCFLYNTVGRELDSVGFDREKFPFDLSAFRDRHPYDLSGGQMQLAAIAKVTSSHPRLLLMDEPTKGIDAEWRVRIAELIRSLTASGTSVLIVTHDADFAAAVADRAAMLFRGQITDCGSPRDFFSGNTFYTTSVCRMMHGIADGVIDLDGAVRACLEGGWTE